MLALALLLVASCATPRECTVATHCARAPTTRAAHAAPSASAPEPPLELYLESSDKAKPSGGGLDPQKLKGLRFVGMDNGPVPRFDVRSSDGRRFDSARLVGHQPFVVIFFATWCPVCENKLPLVKKALDRLGPLTVILVSADDPDTFERVPAYLRRHGLERLPVVRGTDYPAFAVSYDPFSRVPLVVVVGRNGGLVDFQMGITTDDTQRLIKAVELARTIGPLRPVRDAGTD